MRLSGISSQAHSQTKGFTPKRDSDGWNCYSFVLEFAQAVKKCVRKKKKKGKQMFSTVSKECDENGVIFPKEIK